MSWEEKDQEKVLWRMDAERLKVINDMLIACEISFLRKDLVKVYELLKSLRRSIHGLLEDTARVDMKNKSDELTKVYTLWVYNKKDNELFTKFYYLCEDMMDLLQISMVEKHSLFFAKKEYDDEDY